MRVIVHLHTILQKQTPQGLMRKLVVNLSAGASLRDLLAVLDMQVDEHNTLFVRQGQIIEPEVLLNEDDEIHIIPAISGGN